MAAGCRIFLATGLASLLVACAHIGDTTPQATMIEPRNLDLSGVIASSAGDVDWPRADWWTRWQDPQLNELVQQAVAQHPDLRIAQARLADVTAQARIAGATQSVQGAATSGLGRQRYPRYATPQPLGGHNVWSNNVGVDLSYDLDLWGKNRASVEASLGKVRASTAELRAVQLALQTAVVRAYVQLALQFDIQEKGRALEANAQRNLGIVRARRRAGLATELDLSRAESAVLESSQTVSRAGQEIAVLRHQVAALSGQGPGAGTKIARPTLKLDVPVAVPANLPAELLGHRPDIVALRWHVEAASRGIEVAHAAFYPNINLVALASLASTATFGGFFNFIDNDALGHRFGVAMSLPLFDGGRREGQYGSSVARYDEAAEIYNKAVLEAMRQVADQLSRLQSLAEEDELARQAEVQARRAHSLAQQGYRAGLTEFGDVLHTQAQLERQQLQVARVRAQRFEVWAQLMTALGGGLEPSPTARLTNQQHIGLLSLKEVRHAS
jgi:NodT family efflux transporter outer membrane factor (OMF) lipoprotein